MSKPTADLLHRVLPWSYGFRSRAARYAKDRRKHPELMAWYPKGRLFDPIASLDMCTPLERAWSARYAATEYTAEGEIVELGAWLGGITLSLVQALPDNPAWAAAPRPIHVYEQFLHDGQRERLERSPLEHDYEEGGSFLHHFERRVEAHADRIAVHVGDVTGSTWTGGAIELLFNDVSKTWSIWNAVRSTFYASLVPEVSTVVEQDFAHAWTPWLHLWHYRARHHFRFVEHVPGAGSVVFRLERELPPDLLAADAFDDYDAAEVEAAYRWAEPLVSGYLRGNVAGAQVVVNLFDNDVRRATEVLAQALVAATPDALIHSELLSDVVPELGRRLEQVGLDDAPDHGDEPGGDERLVPPTAPPTPCDTEALESDLAVWAGRPPAVVSAADGTIVRIDAAPAWVQWLRPDQWVGGTVDDIGTVLGERLPDHRWVGSVDRDDGADETMVLLGTGADGRRVRVVRVPSADEPGAETVFVASPDLDPPA